MIPLKLKAGVRTTGLSPEILLALWVAWAVYDELAASALVVTSGTDGRHSENSKHHCGRAIDLRIWTLPGLPQERTTAEEAARRIQHRLRDDYMVLLETTHLHIQHNG